MTEEDKWIRLRREAAEADRLREDRIRREAIVSALQEGDPLVVLADRCRELELAVAQHEARLEEATDIGANLMLDRMVAAVDSGGRFSDERANNFVSATARLKEARAEIGRLREQLRLSSESREMLANHRLTLAEVRLAKVVEKVKAGRDELDGFIPDDPDEGWQPAEWALNTLDEALAAAQSEDGDGPKAPKP